MLKTAYKVLPCSAVSEVIPSWNDLHMPHTGTAVYDKRGGSSAFRESQPVICVYRHIRKNFRYRCYVRLLHGTYICRRIIPDWVYTLVRLICLYSMRSHAAYVHRPLSYKEVHRAPSRASRCTRNTGCRGYRIDGKCRRAFPRSSSSKQPE